jgi:hypothetical protein
MEKSMAARVKFQGSSNAYLATLIRQTADVDFKAELVSEMRKRAFDLGLKDRIAGSPMLARGSDGDDEYWVDAYGCGYDPRNELGMVRPECLETAAAEVVELTKLTGSVIPDTLPRNRCEFPQDCITLDINGMATADLMRKIGEHQNIQERNSPKTKAWQDASKALAPMFTEMAKRQNAGKL